MEKPKKIMPTIKESSQALADAIEILNELEILFIPDGGTLLGFWRDGKFCEDDHDDIDLTTFDIFWPKAEEIRKKFIERGFEVYHAWPRDDKNNLTGQFAFKRDNAKIDLMFKSVKKESSMAFWTVYGGQNRVIFKAVPNELMVEITKDLKIKLPEIMKEYIVARPLRVEEYLCYRYGDWRKKVHCSQYCHNSDKSILNKNTYESI